MGPLRHFAFWMTVFCIAGALIGIAANTWDWSRGAIFGVAMAAIAIIGTIATREASLRSAYSQSKELDSASKGP